ncbi:putative ABC transport system substrate-binding protein [Enhydrobacter aerosaccus]|uniref:Putative ABC transport system substrate-binding protein n=1 Tax=Enhydrobacter aerosaccus TaxID=225324 RepID=A0A1T4RI53_9HYPH|nr:ABC transporter substrate-binding protein [Enhydrobacter aerosaccus]SKA15567.1 putative ABC transport system substrate-binding protein [Enhydrobacter aerosaccus]
MVAGVGRRHFISALGGTALALPLTAQAQQPAKPARIGFLYPGVSAVAVSRIKALRLGLEAMGYGIDQVEIIDHSSQGDPGKLPGLAADLVARKVDVIVPISPAGVRTAKSATTTIPIVANDLESDPVASGFVASLARPGGNITGVFSDFPDFGTKWLEILKEALPNLTKVVVMRDPATAPTQLDAVTAAARLLRVRLDVVDVRAIAELRHAFEIAAGHKPDAVIVLASPLFGTEPKLIADLALDHRLPTVTLFSEIARAGGLLSYGPDLLETFRQTGTMAGKVLRGQKPADLPVERPTKFEMIVNQRTAKALGITLPNAVLLHADEVIE